MIILLYMISIINLLFVHCLHFTSLSFCDIYSINITNSSKLNKKEDINHVVEYPGRGIHKSDSITWTNTWVLILIPKIFFQSHSSVVSVVSELEKKGCSAVEDLSLAMEADSIE